MKYLKRFESVLKHESSIRGNELRDFINSHLSFLIDDGFRIRFSYTMDLFSMGKEDGESLLEFKWDDIKYEFIPFLEILVDKYNIDPNITAELTHGAFGDITTPKQIRLKEILDDSEYLSKLKLRQIKIKTR